VASTINEQFSALKEAHPETLARHWTEAGEIEPAIAEWSRAGKSAQERSAFWEAQESYEQALALVALLPDSPEHYMTYPNGAQILPIQRLRRIRSPLEPRRHLRRDDNNLHPYRRAA
jgi:predicted ATPase